MKKKTCAVMLAAIGAACAPAAAQVWTEQGDAGQSLFLAGITSGPGPLVRIIGTMSGTEADMYVINITDPAAFSASTVGGAPFDTQLFLFDYAQRGIAFNDDTAGGAQSLITGQFVPAAGRYLLAVSRYDYDPFAAAGDIWLDTPYNTQRAPDGPGAAGTLNGWGGNGSAGVEPYAINLTGAEFMNDTTPVCLPSFASQVLHPAQSSTSCVLVEDFNSDGRPDVVVLNAVSNSITSLVGNGNGGFLPGVNYAVGTNPNYGCVADFNTDGRLDVVTSSLSGNNLSFLAGNGDGTFAASVPLAAGSTTAGIVAEDMNRDGNPDLVFSTGANAINVMLGNGNGTFQARVGYGAANAPRDVAVADFNRDGLLDVACANAGFNAITVALGTGGGALGAPFNVTALTNPYGIATGDLNGDGRVDMVCSTASVQAQVGVFLGNGNGTFQPVLGFNPQGSTAYRVGLADVNLDAALDIVIPIESSFSSGGAVALMLGRGNGSFQNPVNYPAAGSSMVRSVGVADFNGDGKMDMVAGNSGSSIAMLAGISPSSPPALVNQPSPQAVFTGDSASFSVAAVGPSLAYQWRKNGANLVNGGAISGATTATLTINPSSLSDWGAFDCVVTNPCGRTVSIPAALLVADQCGTADFDGDGDAGTDADIEAFFRVLGGGPC